MSATDVLEQALSLSESERLRLAERLLVSVDRETSADSEFDLDPAYEVELRHRLDEMELGVGVTYDAWESLASIEKEQFMSSTDLLNAMLQLPPKDRRDLVYSVWKSLDASDQVASTFEESDSAAFADEIERRLDDAVQDRNLLCDGDEVLREARNLVGQKSC